MELRKLGLTNESVSVVCLGGWHIGNGAIAEEQESIRLMHRAIDLGINFFDNAWDYNDGDSEERMGKALAQDGKREKVFLMTKNCERDYEGSMRDLEDSLRRLKTSYIDLWQFHEINYDNDPDWVFNRGGIEAAIKAREQGKVRFIGFTGHKDPRLHLEMLARPFLWDACQMPINVMDAHYRSFQKQVVPVCKERGIGVIGMKGLGGGSPTAKILDKTTLSASDCYRYALSQNIDSMVMGIRTMEQLEADAALAKPLMTMGSEEQERLLERAGEWSRDGGARRSRVRRSMRVPIIGSSTDSRRGTFGLASRLR